MSPFVTEDQRRWQKSLRSDSREVYDGQKDLKNGVQSIVDEDQGSISSHKSTKTSPPRRNDDDEENENVEVLDTIELTDLEVLKPSEEEDAAAVSDNNNNDEDNSIMTPIKRHSLSELIAAIRQGKSIRRDHTMERRVLDFERARVLRLARYNARPWYMAGIFGLFMHLAEVRIDLAWAENAAYRRTTGQPYMSWHEFDDKCQTRFSRPIFVFFLILISTFMMFYTMYLSDWTFAPLHVNLAFGPSPQALLQAGALHTSHVLKGEW